MRSNQNLLFIFLSLIHIPWSLGAPSPLDELNINLNLESAKRPVQYEEDIHESKSKDDEEMSSDSNDYQLLLGPPSYQYNTLGNMMRRPGLNNNIFGKPYRGKQGIFGAIGNGYNSGQRRPFGNFNPYGKLGNGYNYGTRGNRQNPGIIGTLGNGFNNYKQGIYGTLNNRQNRGIIGTLGNGFNNYKQGIYGTQGNRQNRGIIGTLGNQDKLSIYGKQGLYGTTGNYYNPSQQIGYPHFEGGAVKHDQSVDGKLDSDEAAFNDGEKMDDIDEKSKE